jgi:hypothetical protein
MSADDSAMSPAENAALVLGTATPMGAASLPMNADPSGFCFELPHLGDRGLQRGKPVTGGAGVWEAPGVGFLGLRGRIQQQ